MSPVGGGGGEAEGGGEAAEGVGVDAAGVHPLGFSRAVVPVKNVVRKRVF